VASNKTLQGFGLDTSAVLRLLTGQPPAQAKRAFALVNEAREAGRRAIVSDLVVSEAYFALHTHYHVPKRQAVHQLLKLLQSGLVEPELTGCALDALQAMATGPQKPGFVDRLIHAQYARLGARSVSFDRAFRKLTNALLLAP